MNLLQKVKRPFNTNKSSDSAAVPAAITDIKEDEMFRKMLESIPSPVTYVTRDHYYQFVNKAYADWLGIQPKEVIGKHVKDFLGEKTYETIRPFMEIALSGEVAHYEEEIEFKQKGKRFINATYTPQLDPEGKVIGYIALIQDITEKRNTELSLADSERRYRNFLKALPAAVYTTDAAGFITMFNQAAVELWGRTPELGKDMWCGSYKILELDGITEVPLDKCPMAISLKEKRKVVCSEPFMLIRPDGQKKYFVPHPEPIFDVFGNLIGGINMLMDVTDNRLAEEQRARLAAIVQSSDDTIISKNLDGYVTSWNPGAERLFGYTAQEMIGQHISKLIPNDRLYEEEEILSRIRKGVSVEHYETKRITKNGSIIDISLTVSPVRDSKGKIIGASKIARDITTQKKLHEELRENEERLRMAIETTQLGSWEFHPNTKDLFCSKECKRILGVSDDFDPDNQYAYDHTYPEDREMVKQQIRAAITPGGIGSCQFEYRITTPDHNQLKWVKVYGKSFFDNDGNPSRFIGTLLDITEEKNREQILQDSIDMFQTMADNVPAMIWMSGSDKFDDFFNKTWLNFRGRGLDEEANEGWLDGVHPDDVQRCIETYNESFKQQKGFSTEYRLLRHDGAYRWITDNSVPRFSADGQFLGFISACMDIDDQKRFREKIQDSELLFKSISNASPAALWMTDANEQNVFVSDTWLKWTGKTFEEVIERGWVQSLIEEDRGPTMQNFHNCFESRKSFHTEFRFLKKDGEIHWGLTEGYPYYDINGEFAGYAGSVTDITEIKKLELRKDDFIKMASHELKTPITSINGYVQLLLNIYSELDDKKLQLSKATVKSSLTTISKQVTKLTRLISELLDLSRIESGKLELNKTKFELSDLVEETVRDVRLTTSKHAIILNNEFLGKIYGDKDRIAQVLMNLLTNAIKYSPDADQVEVNMESEGKWAVIQVKDYGIGIEKKNHQKIFERFYRVEGKSEQTYPGFGIGLFIASEIVHRHEGLISVESEKGKGSIFTVKFPILENHKVEQK